MRVHGSFLVSTLMVAAIGCGGPEPLSEPAEDSPTPSPTAEPTPQPTPDACAGVTSFEAPSAPDAGASFTMLGAPEQVDGFVIESGSVDVVGTYWLARCGVQSLDLSGGEPGAIYRDVATTPGAAYRVRFAFSGNPYDDTDAKLVRIYWDGVALDELSFVTDGFGPDDMGWKFFEYDVTATGATSRLRFQSLTLGVYGPALDAISVTAL